MGVVFGALLGAGFALLYAPDRGDKTRRELKRRLTRLREDAEDGIERVGDRARRELVRRRRRLEEGIDRAADSARDILE
jgi:gas vesicle protein